MDSILDLCKPRPEILAGTFNPEVFTAALSPIIEFYRGNKGIVDNPYTDARFFFEEATYPTQGLCSVLAEVFGRLAGDLTVPAIHRLETAFGGGKTHALIAAAHIAYKGTELQDVTANILPRKYLPEPGSISVVGIGGEEIEVHKPRGEALVPYTLWGEIAYQIGGEELYREVEADVSSYAAPGKTYFEKVFDGRRVLIMLDELAQYAARLEAARPDGASQLAAFLMALHGYARNHAGIAILLTLASATDAFNKQTQRLAELVSQVRGDEVSEDDALGIGEKAVRGVTSVVARDAVQIIPVQASEISSVLAKRLFVFVDRDKAHAVVDEYMEMYTRNSAFLPEEATSTYFKDRMLASYPFHPTLVDFLNNKLADAENFQGTRGVLRVLALVVRSLWEKQQQVPMIHTCHLDLRAERVVNEILGRTGSSDLLFILNADVGGVDTGTLEGGLSNAEMADRKNPHPQGYPLYEYTWKTVFLQSLVGREEGIESKILGITEPEALFSVSFPGLTPPQVRKALEAISETAFYLRFEQGKYYANENPTINSVLARIRKTVQGDQIENLLQTAARKIIIEDQGPFHVEHDVTQPEHLPDDKNKPVLGVVSLAAETIDLEAMVTTKGLNRPRERQNLILLLVPETVTVRSLTQQQVVNSEDAKIREARHWIQDLARQVKAMRILAEKPQSYGVNPQRIQEEGFRNRHAEREQALDTAVASVYTSLYYPSAEGHVVRREIKTGGGEGGAPFIEQIRKILITDGKLLTGESTTQADLLSLNKLIFSTTDTVTLEQLWTNFCCKRSWPVLESYSAFEQIVRAGVQKGSWYVFRMGSEEKIKPEELYHQDNIVPLSVTLPAKGYSLITPQGAKQRGWTETDRVDPAKIRAGISRIIAQKGLSTVESIANEVVEQYGEVGTQEIQETVSSLVKEDRLYACQGSPEQEEKPDLISGAAAVLYTAQPDDVIITPAEAARRGWITAERPSLDLMGKEGAKKLLPLLGRLGSLYNKGAQSVIDYLELVDLCLPGGGLLTLRLEEVPPESMKTLDELFEVLDGLIDKEESAEAFLKITDPDEKCLLIRELQKE
ncbi:MAG: DUF499 domain-containing protein [Dethiobacteria bacterium]|nr:DUF499 domain-containing protein [Bacillota bacterium]HHU98038.1 DUF499 domain-containing protein [Petrimonas sp.]